MQNIIVELGKFGRISVSEVGKDKLVQIQKWKIYPDKKTGTQKAYPDGRGIFLQNENFRKLLEALRNIE